ncbi:MAG TPA: acyl-CoA dehydrogenase family protein [Candidatus Acidoferrales bacterium]|nr:acyl-CoA dehydrogenase family protein [Candidatus Acidoferrales bacterium]
MNPLLDDAHLRLQQRARAWVEHNLIGRAAEENDDDDAARRLVRDLGAAGFLAHAVPKAFGGARETVQARDLCVIREELARGSALADTMFAVQALGSYPITLAGSEEQKARYLPDIASGRAIAAFALTEPQAGSDIGAMETRATNEGAKYILNGVKRFISNAGIAHNYVVFAVTASAPDKRQVSAFVVPADTPGVALKERLRLLSPHPIGTVAFEDCAVPQINLLGREGEGLKIALATLDMLRPTVGAAAVGLAARALEEALRYSLTRRQFGRELAAFQATQFKLADMATELEASRLLVYRAAWTNDCGAKDLKTKSSMAKLYATEAAQRIVDAALQIHGATGVLAGTPVERLYRDVRALRIYEGTSEIQRLIIAKSLLRKE